MCTLLKTSGCGGRGLVWTAGIFGNPARSWCTSGLYIRWRMLCCKLQDSKSISDEPGGSAKTS